MRRLVIGNPENRRVGMYQTALRRQGQAAASILPYHELLTNGDLTPLHNVERIRIESPGENFTIERQLIALGAKQSVGERSEWISETDALRLPTDPGRLRFLRQGYLGYQALLDRLAAAELPKSTRFINSPLAIAEMFDKPRCQERLQVHGVDVPARLADVTDYSSLRSAAAEAGWSRVFVKPAHSSSAAGVVAIHFLDAGVRATTATEVEDDGDRRRYYNNLRVRTYQDESIVRALVDFLFAEGAHAEQWIPKAVLDGVNFDLRVVVIAGRPQHMVVRGSRSPLTNLHLGNRRGDLESLRRKMPDRHWTELLQLAERTAEVFPDCLYLGVDIALRPGYRRPTVLEVNAFGDLLPNVLVEGLDTYEAEVVSEMSNGMNAHSSKGGDYGL